MREALSDYTNAKVDFYQQVNAYILLLSIISLCSLFPIQSATIWRDIVNSLEQLEG